MQRELRVLCGGDQLMCERQVGAHRLTRCADTVAECLEILEPVLEDWHASFLRVSNDIRNVYIQLNV